MVVVVKWNFNLFVNNGQLLTTGDKIEGITAYDKVSITVPSEEGATPVGKTVDLQPSEIGNVVLLCVTSDVYQKSGEEKLYYTLANDTDAEENYLESAHVLIGTSLVKLLGGDLTKLKFINKTGKEANIEIIVGRKASD